MLVKLDVWETIRESFTQDEKDQLNKALIGEVICPRAVILNENDVDVALLNKLNAKYWAEYQK